MKTETELTAHTVLIASDRVLFCIDCTRDSET